MAPPLSSLTTPTLLLLLITILISTTSPLLLTVTALGSSSTIAVAYDSNSSVTICGIVAGEPSQRIQCYKESHSISIEPNVSFDSISAGRGFLCGLRSGGISLLCWDTTNFQPKRLFYSPHHRLTDLTVGNSQVCAVQVNAKCWRFPSPSPELKLRTITSGGGFSCGILKNNSSVICRGESEIGDEIQGQFGNSTMSTIVAGESHVCGFTKSGFLICKGDNVGGQLNVPSHSGFEFSGLVLGANHSCTIRRKNGIVICWGGGSKRSEFSNFLMKYVSFESIVAGLDFTCGLTTKNLSINCWGPGWSNQIGLGNAIPLPMVIPGPCVQSSCRVCGIYPNSDTLCDGSKSICKSCDTPLPIPALIPPLPPPALPSAARNRLFLGFGIVGLVGAFAGICTIMYCLYNGVYGLLQKKIYNYVQPNIANNGPNLPPLRSASVKYQTLNRQRSGTSSRFADRAENFSLLELSFATNDFSLGNKIGGGSFGTVYRGKLVNGREVAIKRGETNGKTKKFQEKETAFDSELALLPRLHHKHLVELLGFCQEKDERLLVYEYMSNGSLYDHIHSKNNVNKSCSILNSWKMRIKIALDAARGIKYLHNYAVPTIIHRDIKSSNILLDSNWTAKVSDFGLSTYGSDSIEESVPIKAVGTVGYIDPEYYVLNILTDKSDVYGFGVVLLELLTGKRAVSEDEESGPMGVVEYARPWISAGEFYSVLDTRVGQPGMSEAEAVEQVAYTAMHCVNLEGKERPNITDIVANLERAMGSCEGSHGSISSTSSSTTSH